MSNVFVRVVFLFISLVMAVSAEDFPLTGDLSRSIPLNTSGKPTNLSQPAVTVDDYGVSSPFFGIGISTPQPTNEDNALQITYSDDPKRLTEPLTLEKKRKGGPIVTADAPEVVNLNVPVSVAPSSSPPFGSPSHSHEGERALKKSHTMLLKDLENLVLPRTPTAPSTEDALGDLSESTVFSTEEEDD